MNGYIKDLKEKAHEKTTGKNIYEVKIYDKAILLNEGNTNKFYPDGTQITAIIQDIVESVGLTFSNNFPSADDITIERRKIYQDRNPMEAVNELCETLGAVWRVENSTFILYKYGETYSSIDINAKDGDWFLPDGWNDDTSRKYTRVIVKGAKILQRTTENLTGTDTVFYTTRTPEDVQIEGLTQTTETINGDYKVIKGDFEVGGSTKKGKIIFNNSQTDPTINYSYYSRIRVESGSGKCKEVQKNYIESSYEARQYARKFLNIYANGFSIGEFNHPYPTKFNFNNLILGYKVNVTNKLNPNRDGEYIITKLRREYPRRLAVTVGEDTTDLGDWRKETKDRVKQLEEIDQNADFIQIDENLSSSFNITATASFTHLFTVEETGEILFASETALTNESDMIYDDGSEPSTYPVAVEDSALSNYPNSYTNYLES